MEFLDFSTVEKLDCKSLCGAGGGGGCHVLCRMVNNTPGLCPLDARTTSSPPKATTKHVSRHGQGSPPPRGSPAENPWGGAITSFFNNCVEFCSMNVLSFIYLFFRASQVALMVKNPPANAGDIRDTVRSLGREDPLEEGMATHSSYSCLENLPRTEQPSGLQSLESQRVWHDWSDLAHMHAYPSTFNIYFKGVRGTWWLKNITAYKESSYFILVIKFEWLCIWFV